jgi:hypothetical protein
MRAAGRRLLVLFDSIGTRLAALVSMTGLGCLAVVLLLASAVTGWLDAPLDGAVAASRIPIGLDLGSAVPSGRPPYSIGLLCVVVAVIAAVTLRRSVPGRVRAHLGAAIIVGTVAFPLIVVGRNPALLEALMRQGAEREAIRVFANIVHGYSSGLPQLDLAGTATLADRVQTTLQVLGWGWWFAIAGALVLIGTAGPAVRRAGAVLGTVAWTVMLLAVSGLIAGPAVIAEDYRIEGDRLYAAGEYADALARYDHALSWAPQLGDNAALQYHRGAAEYWLGGPNTAGARVFIAENLRRNGEIDRALDVVGRARLDEPQLRWLRRRLAGAYAEAGLREARLGAFGTAAERWQRAREVDDTLARLHYYLAHAFYQLHGPDQGRAITEARHLTTLVRNRAILSDLFTVLGDCHFKAARDVEARQMYRTAMAMVPLFSHVNLRAQKGLMGL